VETGGGSSVRTISSGSKGSSGSGTPVRKISAHEFERGGLTKPLVTTIDGTPTFLSPPVSSEVTGQIRKRSRHDVQVRGLNYQALVSLILHTLSHLHNYDEPFVTATLHSTSTNQTQLINVFFLIW
jgi:hypothetical protein